MTALNVRTGVLAALVALIAACGPGPETGNDGGNPDASCTGKADCGSTDGGKTDGGDGGQASYIVTATLPNADLLAQDFIVNGVGVQLCAPHPAFCPDFDTTTSCTNANTCEIWPKKPLTVKVKPDVAGYVFAPVSASVDEQHPTGSPTWGAGKYGVAIGDKDHWVTYTWNGDPGMRAQIQIYTAVNVENQGGANELWQVILLGVVPWWDGTPSAIDGKAVMTDHSFTVTYDDGTKLEATVNASKSAIDCTLTNPDSSTTRGQYVQVQ